VALNSVQFNVARAIGPALGGLLVSIWSPGVAFLLNAASFLAVIVVLLFWRNDQQVAGERSESAVSAMMAGARFVRHSPVLRAVLVRTAVFVVFASAIWALLPVATAHELHTGSSGYGVLLGCLGAGSVAAAISFARLRTLVEPDRLVVGSTLLYAAATTALGVLGRFELVCIAMLGGGIAWMGAMSTFNVTAQLALPAWVRARALAFYIFTYQAGLALGSWMWGEVALRIGTRRALLIAAMGLVAGVSAMFKFRLGSAGQQDLTPSMHWPEPVLQSRPEPEAGPVLVEVEYRIDPRRASEFLEAMHLLGVTRRRDGALRWGIFADTAEPGRYVETFLVESWGEHLRQHARVTKTDQQLEERVRAFQIGDQAPAVRHLMWADETGARHQSS
jgi:predicted MFS family arabinose efflux permease